MNVSPHFVAFKISWYIPIRFYSILFSYFFFSFFDVNFTKLSNSIILTIGMYNNNNNIQQQEH